MIVVNYSALKRKHGTGGSVPLIYMNILRWNNNIALLVYNNHPEHKTLDLWNHSKFSLENQQSFRLTMVYLSVEIAYYRLCSYK